MAGTTYSTPQLEKASELRPGVGVR